jgi:dihydroorotate dehydrogenase
MFYQLIRQLLFKLPAEMAHTFTLQLLKWFSPLICTHSQISSPQKLWEMNFANPVGLAAGLDKNGDYIIPLAKLGFGFIEIGTVTPRPQPGNPKPRLFRLPAAHALINRMGFNNKGVDYLVEKVKQANFQGILGINIGKNFDTDINDAINDYLICLEKVYPYASYITVNISSPNTPGLRALQYGDYLAELLAQLKEKQLQLQQQHHKYIPLLLKIAPDLQATEIKEIAELLLQYKMDGVIATNTTLDKTSVENLPFGAEQGGLSGQP